MIMFGLLHLQSICSTICSSCREKFFSYGYAPCSSSAASSESSTCIGAVCIVCAPWTSSYCGYHPFSCSCCAFFSLFHSPCSSLSFYWTSCNILSISSNLCFSLLLCVILLSCFHIFASTSKATFSLNLQLCHVSVPSLIFLMHFSCTSFFASCCCCCCCSLW